MPYLIRKTGTEQYLSDLDYGNHRAQWVTGEHHPACWAFPRQLEAEEARVRAEYCCGQFCETVWKREG